MAEKFRLYDSHLRFRENRYWLILPALTPLLIRYTMWCGMLPEIPKSLKTYAMPLLMAAAQARDEHRKHISSVTEDEAL